MKCIPRERFPINFRKLEYMKMLKKYIFSVSQHAAKILIRVANPPKKTYAEVRN
jgi:hypothetical protein